MDTVFGGPTGLAGEYQPSSKSLESSLTLKRKAEEQRKKQEEQPPQRPLSVVFNPESFVAMGLSLNDPSVIVSTPVPKNRCRRSSIFNGNNHQFSPIVLGSAVPNANSPKTPKEMTKAQALDFTDVNLLRESGNGGKNGTHRSEMASNVLPSLSELSMGDLTSLLVKTGKVMPDPHDLERLNITEQLHRGQSAEVTDMVVDEDVMEEMELLMVRLDRVFGSFKDDQGAEGGPNLRPSTSSSALLRPPRDTQAVGGIVSELADQIHTFTYQFRLDHEL